MRVRGRAKRERHLLHFRHRNQRAEDAAHQREELDLAADEHLERGWIAALDLVVFREDLRLDAAARLRSDDRPHLNQSSVQRAGGRLVVELGEGVVGGAQRPAET